MLPDQTAKALYVQILKPGEYVAVQTLNGLAFFQVTVDGGLKPLGWGDRPSPPPPPLDGEDKPLTLATEIESLRPPLTVRTYNVLKREGINTVGDMLVLHAQHGMSYFHALRNIGGKGADEIAATIHEWKRVGL